MKCGSLGESAVVSDEESISKVLAATLAPYSKFDAVQLYFYPSGWPISPELEEGSVVKPSFCSRSDAFFVPVILIRIPSALACERGLSLTSCGVLLSKLFDRERVY
jgi:hypothetical protein